MYRDPKRISVQLAALEKIWSGKGDDMVWFYCGLNRWGRGAVLLSMVSVAGWIGAGLAFLLLGAISPISVGGVFGTPFLVLLVISAFLALEGKERAARKRLAVLYGLGLVP